MYNTLEEGQRLILSRWTRTVKGTYKRGDIITFEAPSQTQMSTFDVDMNNEGILLCSDGLTTMLADDQIEKVLIDEELDAEEKVVKLIQKCNARGGFDNVSIAYLEKDEGDN